MPTTPSVHVNRHLMKCSTPSVGALSITWLTAIDTFINRRPLTPQNRVILAFTGEK